MASYLLRCTECGDVGDVYCDGDSPLFCQECRSVDCFEEIDNEEV